MEEKTKEASLKVYIITGGKSEVEEKKEVLVELKGDELVEKFIHVLSTQGKKRAIKFALFKGNVLTQLRDSAQLILTEDAMHWDLMP